MRVLLVEDEPYMAEAIRDGLRLDDKTTGFQLGADDYLTKPFELQELVLASERLTAGARTTGRPCERSPVCGWIRSAARSAVTAATSR